MAEEDLHLLCSIPVAMKSSTGFLPSLAALTQSQQVSRTTFTPSSIDERITPGSAVVAKGLQKTNR